MFVLIILILLIGGPAMAHDIADDGAATRKVLAMLLMRQTPKAPTTRDDDTLAAEVEPAINWPGDYQQLNTVPTPDDRRRLGPRTPKYQGS